jgi:TrmH family RNA methyltransferase
MEIISSRSNPIVKEARALRQRKSRQESGLFIVEGIRHVGEADEAGAEIVSIWHAPDLLESAYALQLVNRLAERGVACYACTQEVFESLAEKDNPQGLLAIVRPPVQTLAALQPGNFPWSVALVDPQDPGNLGAVLRTIDAVGASGLLLLESEPGRQSTVEPYHPSAVRASMGALFWHPVVSASFDDFINWAAEHGYHIYGTSAHAKLDYRAVQAYRKPCILLMGSEREGLTSEQTACCEALIRLPMHGHCSSLNLAVATGVMLYAMLELFD